MFDTLAIAFVATCRSGPPDDPDTYWSAVPPCSTTEKNNDETANSAAAGQSLIDQTRVLNLQQAIQQQFGGAVTP